MKLCCFSLYLLCFCSELSSVFTEIRESYLIKEFAGSLSTELNILFAIERPTFISTTLSCTRQCEGDRRCIGFEICKIHENLYQCRACCSWKKLGKEKANKNLDHCAYFRLVNDDKKGYVNVALQKPTSLSSTNEGKLLSGNAVDDVLVCTPSAGNFAHSGFQHNPWLKIDLQKTFDIESVLVYARQDCCEPGRLQNAMVTVSNGGENHTCGFYPGPTYLHDRILVLCESAAMGRFVTIALHLEPGTTTALQVCEVQVYGKVLALL